MPHRFFFKYLPSLVIIILQLGIAHHFWQSNTANDQLMHAEHVKVTLSDNYAIWLHM